MTDSTPQPQTVPAMLKAFNDGRNSIAYRPSFSRLTGSVTAAILLQQISYRFDANGNLPYYKFKEAPKKDNPKYKSGDSWCEELAFTRSEFDTALSKIGTKITEGHSKRAALEYKLPVASEWTDNPLGYGEALVKAVRHLVVFWTDGNHVTWYQVNVDLLTEFLVALYDPKVEILLYLDKYRNRLYLDKVKIPLYLYSESTKEEPKNKTLSAQPPEPGKVTRIHLPDTPVGVPAVRDPIAEEIAIIDDVQRKMFKNAEKLLAVPNPIQNEVPKAVQPSSENGSEIPPSKVAQKVSPAEYAPDFWASAVRAATGKVLAAQSDEFKRGDLVYWSKQHPRWKGSDYATSYPAIVLKVNGKTVRVAYRFPSGDVQEVNADPDALECGRTVSTRRCPGELPTFYPVDPANPEQWELDALAKSAPKVRPVFNAIALGSFNMANVPNGKGGYIGVIESGVTDCTDEANRPTLAADLAAMYAWYKKTYPNLSAPSRTETICKYLAEWRQAVRVAIFAPIAAPRLVADPDLPGVFITPAQLRAKQLEKERLRHDG